MTPDARRRLRLVTNGDRARAPVASFASRNGATYYLHEGVTKTGKPRYFVRKTIGEGALAELPDGFEFHETLNGVVAVRRIREPSPIPAADVELVRGELARHPHLSGHRVELRDEGIVVFEPEMHGFELRVEHERTREIKNELQRLGIVRGRRPDVTRRYAPVMRFELATPAGSGYVAKRMTYRGDGGWMLFEVGPLSRLVRNLAVLGTDAFFELY